MRSGILDKIAPVSYRKVIMTKKKPADIQDYVADAYRIVENTPDLYLILNADFTIVGVSNAYLAATLVKREQILGRNMFEIFPDNPTEIGGTGSTNLRYSLNSVLEKKIPHTMSVQKYDIRLPESEGGDFIVRYWSPINTPVLDEEGEVRYIIHRAEDVTEFIRLKRVEAIKNQETEYLLSRTEQMEVEIYARAQEIQAVNKLFEMINKELENFAYITSHDLKAPLRGIDSLANWIINDSGNQLTEQSNEWFSLLMNKTRQMNSIIEGILAYSKVGKINHDTTKVDVNQLLKEIISNLTPPENFSIQCQENMPIFITSRVPLEQVFLNLISNALKHHNRKDGTIQVGFREINDFYEFFVKDDGPGINPKNHEKIFEIFQTLKSRDHTNNSGIGLSIVKKIVTALKGKITIDSEEGKGCTFTFTWPKTAELKKNSSGDAPYALG